jgi:tetratricopeptide (TPR) repeat protein
VNVERIRALAFEGRLRPALAALDRPGPGAHDASEAEWLRAYLLAAVGDFRAAEAIADRLARTAPSATVRARATVTLGSVLRQTGRHGAARVVEEAALATAPGAELRRHLLIGLAADAVGLGELEVVVATLRRAGSELVGGWRAGVRLRWVRCERDLLAGRPAGAARHARDAVALSRRAGARRHEAKSLLFAGAALRAAAARGHGTAAEEEEARRSLREAGRIAARIGARPVADVAAALLGGRPATRR